MIQLAQYVDLLGQLLTYSSIESAPPVKIDLIINPEAGAFRSKWDLKRYTNSLAQKLDSCRQARQAGKLYRREIISLGRYYTHFSQHAEEIAAAIIGQDSRAAHHAPHLLLIVGGDGTSNQVCSALIKALPPVRDNIRILRFPLGTGNDNADGATLEEVYDLLLADQTTEKIPYLEITARGLAPLYSFNIVGLGVDAYIVDLTHKMKRLVPGDTYKPMVNIGVLFYEQRVKPRSMHIRILPDQGPPVQVDFIPSMVVMGTSGNRTYGGKIPILPAAENICLIPQLNLIQKLKVKKKILLGLHHQIENIRFYKGRKMVIEYNGDFPVQIDGEVIWLEAGHFPLTIELHKPVVSVIKKK